MADHAALDLIELDADACPNLATLDRLCRSALDARRIGRAILVRGASPELRDLLLFAGLADTIACEPESGLDSGR